MVPTIAKLTLFVLALSLTACKFGKSQNQNPQCQEIPNLEAHLKSGQIILIGEIHGTKEGPGYVEQIVCHALKKDLNVSIGLELFQEDLSTIDTYLQSAGTDDDKKKILELPFFAQEYQDGRASQAMFELIESIRKLKTQNQNVDLFLIDDSNQNDRDIAMAEKVIEVANARKDDLFITLTGNYHNMIHEDSGQMGTYVLDNLGPERVLSLKMNYTGGSAWVDVAGEGFGPIGLRGSGRSEIGIFLDTEMYEYHGTLEVDSIHYSKPAKGL